MTTRDLPAGSPNRVPRADGELSPAPRWLLLIHQIPPKPDYLRIKIGRRLQRVGAVPIKNSVYVLPDSEQSFEDLQWIRTEITSGGGDASICRAAFIDGLTSDQIKDLFQGARNADYAAIASGARERWGELGRSARDGQRARTTRPDDDLARLRKRFAAVTTIDFFDAPQGAMAREALDILEAQLVPAHATPALDPGKRLNRAEFVGRTWVTRRNVFVDRIACAWLIRRFIDPDARFKFVREDEYHPARGELRFDMFQGEFTHEGDRCSFEVLLHRLGLDDPALGSLAEVVHDIDLKDGKFGREDAPGIERVLSGIAAAYADDSARVERGSQLLDELYALLSTDPARYPLRREE